MGDIHNINEAYNCSISKLAEIFEIDRATMTKRLKEAVIQPAGKKGAHAIYAIKDAARAIHHKAGPGNPDLDLDLFPEARKAWFQSENERLKFEQATGQLIPEADCARALASLAKTFVSCLDSLPDQLERDSGLTPEVLVSIQEICDGARDSAHEELLNFRSVYDDET